MYVCTCVCWLTNITQCMYMSLLLCNVFGFCGNKTKVLSKKIMTHVLELVFKYYLNAKSSYAKNKSKTKFNKLFFFNLFSNVTFTNVFIEIEQVPCNKTMLTHRPLIGFFHLNTIFGEKNKKSKLNFFLKIFKLKIRTTIMVRFYANFYQFHKFF